MKFIADDIKLQMIDNRPHICFRFPTNSLNICQQILQNVKDFICRNKEVQIDIVKKKSKRSLDANAYCWVLCDAIAKKISRPQMGCNPPVTVTKEEVYKKQIHELGVFETVPIRNDAVEAYIKKWNKRGLGWIAEIIGESKIPGYTNIMTYFGSSVYDTSEMSRLIDGLVSEAKYLGIETATAEELALLKEAWQ